MTVLPDGSAMSAGEANDSLGHGMILRGVPFGEQLVGHTQETCWGGWGRVAGRPVLATAGRDGSMLLWDVERGTAPEMLPAHRRPLLWGRWGRVGGQPVLAIGDVDGILMLRDAGQFSALPVIWTAQRGALYWGEWGLVRGRQVLATGGESGTVLVWDAERDPVLELTGHRGRVNWGAGGGWAVGPAWPPAATTGRCGCGISSRARRWVNRWRATPNPCGGAYGAESAAGRCWPPWAATRPCGSGTSSGA